MDARKKVSWPGWEVDGIIGKGGYGTVYEIHRQVLDVTERAALKVISIPRDPQEEAEICSSFSSKEDVTSMFREYKDSIVKEYATMSRMKGCPNIVMCEDFCAEPHEEGIGWDIYIKMELLTPMRKMIETGISEASVRRMGMDICRALAYCAERNLLHRDIKPANIFVDQDGRFKLGDFGIARTVEAVEQSTYATRIGTTRYMAPEIYNNQPYNASADVYSLGLVMYELLNDLRAPFEPPVNQNLTVSARDNALSTRFGGSPLPSPAHGGRALQAIVLKACDYNPTRRFRSAAEMLKALENPDAFLAALEGTPTAVLNNPVPPVQNRPVQQQYAAPRQAAPQYAAPRQAAPQYAAPQYAARSNPAPNVVAAPKKKSGSTPVVILGVLAAGLFISLIVALIMLGGSGNAPMVNPPVNPPVVGQTEPVPQDNPTNTPAQSEEEYEDLSKRIVSVAAGENHSVGLRADGTVVAIGDNTYGQCSVYGWKDVVAIDAGPRHTVGLCSDGTVMISGDNDRNQLSAGGWSSIAAISVHWDSRYIVGVRTDGTVVCTNEVLRQKTSHWTNIVAVSAGSDLVGLRSDGTILLVSADDNVEYHYITDWTNVSSVVTGAEHAVGLRTDGMLFVAGSNRLGQLDVSGWRDVAFINAGQKNTMCIFRDGTVDITGDYGMYFREIRGWSNMVFVDCGNNLFLGICADGTVVAAGDNTWGECDVWQWNN